MRLKFPDRDWDDEELDEIASEPSALFLIVELFFYPIRVILCVLLPAKLAPCRCQSLHPDPLHISIFSFHKHQPCVCVDLGDLDAATEDNPLFCTVSHALSASQRITTLTHTCAGTRFSAVCRSIRR